MTTTELPSDHWLHGAFDDYNAKFFGGKLPRPQLFDLSASKNQAALSVNTTSGGKSVRMIWIEEERLNAADRIPASESLLHEMIHYALAEENGDADQGHGARFAETATKIGSAIGLRRVRAHSRAAEVWPQATLLVGHREISSLTKQGASMDPDDHYDSVREDVARSIVDAIRGQKKTATRPKPSATALLAGPPLFSPDRRAELIDRIAELVDENIFGRSEMCMQFASLVRSALYWQGIQAKAVCGRATYRSGDQTFSWAHAWVVYGIDTIVDCNVDSMIENPEVTRHLSAAVRPYWGPRKDLPADRSFPTGGSQPPLDSDVEEIWKPDLKAWLLEKNWLK